mgnify:CR=1 FL=1
MKVSFGIDMDKEVVGKFKFNNPMAESISQFIAENNYGESIKKFLIGLICVGPQYDSLAKPRRPKYTEYKEAMFDGWDPFTIEKTFECEIKLDYAKVLEATEEEVKKIVAQSIMDYLRKLKMPKKVTDFDKEKFIADLETYFRKEHLID